MTDWRAKAGALAAELERAGDLRSARWREAFEAVPRHALVPRYFAQRGDGSWHVVDRDDSGYWLDVIYSNTTFVTALDGQQAVSSSTMPSLMASMLETLDVRDGARALEIGTGTGYNAGLLAHRLGSARVFSVDVDPGLVHRARDRLAAIGYTPTLAARDGVLGFPEHSPFDRIICTCAVPAVPRAWIEQLAPDGMILTDYKPSGMAGNLVLLRRCEDSVSGQFLPDWAGFMTMRRPGVRNQPRRPSSRTRDEGRERPTSAPEPPWEYPVAWFLAQLGMPDHLSAGQDIDDDTGEPRATFLAAPDGSWCEVSTEHGDATGRVREGGPVSLWERFERAYEYWRAAGEPGWDRLGLTVTPGAHVVWLDDPDSGASWVLGT